MIYLIAETSVWETALEKGGFFGAAIVVMFGICYAAWRLILRPLLELVREITTNCQSAASDNREAGDSMKLVLAELRGIISTIKHEPKRERRND